MNYDDRLFSKATFKGWLFFVLAGFFFLYEFFCRASFGSIAEIFSHDLHIDAITAGSISSAYFLAYALMQIPVGILLDRFGVRKVGFSAILTTALGCLLFSFSAGVATAWLGRFAIGLGSAFAFAMMFKIILNWFPHKHVGLMAGMTQVLGVIGPILATTPLILWLHAVNNDWRHIFHVVFWIGCILAVFFFLVVRDKQKTPTTIDANAIPKPSVAEKLKQLVSYKQIWVIAIFAFLVYPAVEVIGSMSGTMFMSFSFNQTLASSAVAYVWLGLGLGSPLVGFISDRLQNRKGVLLACALFGAIITAYLIWGTYGYAMSCLLMFLVGVAAGAQTLSFTVAIENTPRYLEATVVGFNNMFVLLGAWAAQNITSIVLNPYQAPHSTAMQIYYTEYGYQVALTVGCVAFFIAALIFGMLFIKETHCRRDYQETIKL